MKKRVEKITRWRENLEMRLRQRLEALPPKARLTIVLVLFSLFAVGCIAMLGSAIYDFGKGKERMRMEHIEKLKLPSRERHTVPYDNETEYADCETDNLDAYETE